MGSVLVVVLSWMAQTPYLYLISRLERDYPLRISSARTREWSAAAIQVMINDIRMLPGPVRVQGLEPWPLCSFRLWAVSCGLWLWNVKLPSCVHTSLLGVSVKYLPRYVLWTAAWRRWAVRGVLRPVKAAGWVGLWHVSPVRRNPDSDRQITAPNEVGTQVP